MVVMIGLHRCHMSNANCPDALIAVARMSKRKGVRIEKRGRMVLELL